MTVHGCMSSSPQVCRKRPLKRSMSASDEVENDRHVVRAVEVGCPHLGQNLSSHSLPQLRHFIASNVIRTQRYEFFIIFGCAEDTHARQSSNKFGFALDLFVSLHA